MITLEHTAGAIYVVRDPLDVAVSYSHHYGVSLGEAVAAMNRPGNQSISNQENFVYELHGSWSEHVRSWTAMPNRALHVVRYEDMAEQPTVLRRDCEIPRPGRRAQPLARAVERSLWRPARAGSTSWLSRAQSEVGPIFRAGEVGQGRLLTPDLIDALCTHIGNDDTVRLLACAVGAATSGARGVDWTTRRLRIR
jgi:hypothetical protein